MLNEGQPLSKKELELALDSVADGVYEVSVRASDEPSNGSGRAMSDELVSDPFVVDRSRPRLEQVKVQGDTVRGLAIDAGSFVHDVAYALDEGSFRAASPSDGIFDGPRESFELRLPALAPGKHRLVLRARDAHGNFVTQALVVES